MDGWGGLLVSGDFLGSCIYMLFILPSLKLTAKASENGWLEDFLLSFWVERPNFQVQNAVSVKGCNGL